jgi:hypothetical protein
MATKKSAKSESSPAKNPVRKPSRKRSAKKSAATKTSGAEKYTKPDLREHIKEEVMHGDKGGRPDQWSARKAQLVGHEYEAQGGAYTAPRDETQQHLKQWGDEKWHTADGKPAIHGDSTSRYLPDKAWEDLTPAQKKATDAKKRRGSKAGKQFVPNTAPAKAARKRAVKKSS